MAVAEWVENPDAPGGLVVSVDQVYQSKDGRYLHVWQTNMPVAKLTSAGQDPVTDFPGLTVPLPNADWIQGSVDRLGGKALTLSTRLPGDITVSVDGSVDEAELRKVAASLQP